jgi:hypothetical protein
MDPDCQILAYPSPQLLPISPTRRKGHIFCFMCLNSAMILDFRNAGLHQLRGDLRPDEHPQSLVLKPGLAIKNPPKKPTYKNPLKMGFLGFLNFKFFYENNTNFSLSNRFFMNK